MDTVEVVVAGAVERVVPFGRLGATGRAVVVGGANAVMVVVDEAAGPDGPGASRAVAGKSKGFEWGNATPADAPPAASVEAPAETSLRSAELLVFQTRPVATSATAAPAAAQRRRRR
jgi:hypothetical protein